MPHRIRLSIICFFALPLVLWPPVPFFNERRNRFFVLLDNVASSNVVPTPVPGKFCLFSTLIRCLVIQRASEFGAKFCFSVMLVSVIICEIG